MRNVMVIPAKRQVGNSVRQDTKPRLRVASYCRVSTDSDEQATSYEAQVSHYTEYIQKNPEWEFAGIFADDGISGTNTKKREEFNRMIEECEAGNIDMIITKSISRFARNTLDCLKYIRKLKDLNIPVFFEKESINTMDAKGEVLLTIMASLAQQESQSLSQNVKLGLQFRYQNGQVQINHNRFLGYTKDANGHLIIDPEQAEVVKRIYREYLEGFSMDKIAAGLERDGILTGAGKTRWHTSTINKILRNEKYIGDALLQKTYTTDFLSKTRVKNNGIVPQYYVEGNHEAIIPRNIYMRVQEELVRRRVVKTSANGKKRSYSCNHCFSQIVVCGECGELFRRIHWNNRGCKSIVWRCISRLEPTGQECHARTVNETVLENVVLAAINEMLGDKPGYQEQLQQNIAAAIRSASTETDDIDEKLMALQQELIQKANNKKSYDAVAGGILRLRELKQQSAMDTSARDEQIRRINELQDFIRKQPTHLTEFDESLVKRWLKQITVYDNHFIVELKSGLRIEIEE
ncbi:recombinase family protein [uncultured Allofournierella sp.]|uniref:recombinase family protein n=1 Tax=uncultured Allofournierella sp. TaxID=1940258 RepID=UPI003751EE46